MKVERKFTDSYGDDIKAFYDGIDKEFWFRVYNSTHDDETEVVFGKEEAIEFAKGILQMCGETDIPDAPDMHAAAVANADDDYSDLCGRDN